MTGQIAIATTVFKQEKAGEANQQIAGTKEAYSMYINANG